LTWGNGGRFATIEMRDVPVIDQPKWPAHGAQTSPARLSFKMIFEATDKAITYDDKAKRRSSKSRLGARRLACAFDFG